MAVFEIYSLPALYRYKSSVWSKASFYVLAVIVLTFIPPLLIAYRSQGFWITTNTYQEQPDVTYKKQLLIVAELANPGEYFAWSTYANFNNLLQGNLRVPQVSSFELDNNRDGLNDQLSLNISVPLTSSEQVVSVHLLVIFDYKLYRMSTFEMESMVYVSQSSALSGAGAKVTGDLGLYQRVPLYHRGADIRFNTPIIDSTSTFASSYDLFTILKNYSQRNITTRLENSYSVWTPGRLPTEPFVLQLDVFYPTEVITYQPGFWELIKWGWVQYATILLLFLWVFKRINRTVFEGNVFNTVVQQPKVKIIKGL
uniref:transmembrane protein 231-like n=1 Tax=Styela clava TaxID=7725 RepID=UPI00193A6F61|nr:transmembrane protein 231-like [Styela clava]